MQKHVRACVMSVWFLLSTVLSLLRVLDAAVTVTSQPQNAVVQSGDSVQLNCEISGDYGGYFEWRQFKVGSASSGNLIYTEFRGSYYNRSDFPPAKFVWVPSYSLRITQLAVADGGRYKCYFAEDVVSYNASVTVIGINSLLLLSRLLTS